MSMLSSVPERSCAQEAVRQRRNANIEGQRPGKRRVRNHPCGTDQRIQRGNGNLWKMKQEDFDPKSKVESLFSREKQT